MAVSEQGGEWRRGLKSLLCHLIPCVLGKGTHLSEPPFPLRLVVRKPNTLAGCLWRSERKCVRTTWLSIWNSQNESLGCNRSSNSSKNCTVSSSSLSNDHTSEHWYCYYGYYGLCLYLSHSGNKLGPKSELQSRVCVCVCVCVYVLVSLLCPTLHDPWTIARQASLSMEFSRQEYSSGLPFPSPEDLPDPEIKPGSTALQADSLPSEPPGKPVISYPSIIKYQWPPIAFEKVNWALGWIQNRAAHSIEI